MVKKIRKTKNRTNAPNRAQQAPGVLGNLRGKIPATKKHFGLVAFAILAGLAMVGMAKSVPVQRQLDYSDCQIEYGTIVNEWNGAGNEEWNQAGYHYITRIYSVMAEAPEQFFENVIEVPPGTLSSSRSEGSACLAGFDGLVDTDLAQMRWYGGKSVDARLGLPALEQNNDGASSINTIDTEAIEDDLTPPLFNESFNKAAVALDDGGYAALENAEKTRQRTIWCQGFEPSGSFAECQAQLQTSGPVTALSRGYLFTADNCPAEVDSCLPASSWYADFAVKNIKSFVGANPDGSLKPFYLHLNAVSTRGYQIGNHMLLTYKYPIEPDINASLKQKTLSLEPGSAFKTEIELSAFGPDLAELRISTPDLPENLKKTSDFKIEPTALEAVNKGTPIVLSAEFSLNQTASGCADLPIALAAKSHVPNAETITKNLNVKVCAQLPVSTNFSFSVNTRGDTSSNLNEFAALALETLNSTQGWNKAGVGFKKVTSGGDFKLFLSTPGQMSSFSSGCDEVYSCRVGSSVIINEKRWNNATKAWNDAGGNLRDYRHMVINHEVGHWLGFGHSNCPGTGQKAPVMQQQSIDLQGCKFNPWPLPGEIAALKARI